MYGKREINCSTARVCLVYQLLDISKKQKINNIYFSMIVEYTGGSTGARSEIKKLKVKYGLDRRHAGIPTTKSEAKYTDRASSRRVEVGSDNPFAKTEVASANT